MLKIFVDGYILNKEHQGTKTYIIELYKEFAKRNPEVKIYIGCFETLKIQNLFLGIDNITFINYKNTSRVYRMFFEIPNIIRKYNFNFAHFQYVIPFIRSKSCKYIVTIHDILFNDFKQYFSKTYRLKRNFLFKFSAKNADFVLTVSNYSKERIIDFYNIKNKEIYITSNGVNSDYFKKYDKQVSVDYIFEKYKVRNFILYVSRIEPRKNQQVLLEVFKKLDIENLNLVFIGFNSLKNNKFEKDLYEIDKSLRKKILVINTLDNIDLLHFYKASKLFVYPSLAEGFGIPPLEAAAFNIPVICNDNTALKDFYFFKPYLFDFNDKNKLLRGIKSILNRENLNLEKIKNQIFKTYNWESASRVLEKIILK